ncbi:MAG TPA: glycosyltransferase family 2 protein [Candidatus Krumholzibacteria bacterium]|nr:glycosyltransferase family 2 protein [Candidatus Krumholzibacteria bacterium]
MRHFSTLELSVVIPVHDEETNVGPLADEIEASLKDLRWECIWVDDASTDQTLALLGELEARPEGRHRVLRFQEQRGQSAALIAGFKAARGEFVASLDGDGQNDPADLPRLLAIAHRQKLDMVNGVRVQRRDDWIRVLSSRIGNGFRNLVTGDHITDVGCSTRVFKREYVDAIPHFNGMHRFLPTFVRAMGGAIGEAPVSHRPRAAGQTKYGVGNRLFRGLADTFGVRWYARRAVKVDAVAVSDEEAESMELRAARMNSSSPEPELTLSREIDSGATQ